MKIGLLADIHEDLPSLKKALKILAKKGVNEIYCLGDICGYSFPHYKHEKKRDASGCLDLIRQECSLILPGNHDLYACRNIPKSDTGFDYPDNWYNLDFARRKELAGSGIWLYEDTELESNLNDEDKEFIRSLDESKIIKIDGKNILLSHFIYPDFTGSSTIIIPDMNSTDKHIDFMKDKNCELSFFGHSHVEGSWAVQKGSCRRVKLIKLYETQEIAGIGLPCVANGLNQPGVSIYDTEKEIVKTSALYPIFRKGLTL